MKTLKRKKDKNINDIMNFIRLLKWIINKINLNYELNEIIAEYYSPYYRNIDILRKINLIVRNKTIFEKEKKMF